MPDTNGATGRRTSLATAAAAVKEPVSVPRERRKSADSVQRLGEKEEENEDGNEAIVLSRVVRKDKPTPPYFKSIPIHPPSLPSAHLFFA